MKVLLGICGFGNGHSARQADILRQLNARGHDVALLVSMNSQRYMAANFPQNVAFEVRVPIIYTTTTGVDFRRSAEEPFNRFEDGWSKNFGAMQGVLDYFHGTPDLVITDYELTAGQFAYACGLPLITIDQQGKFAGFQLPEVNGYTRAEEKSKLSMFFPAAAARYACSFFKLPWDPDPGYPVELVPPILRESFRQLASTANSADSSTITVYFSPHVQRQQSLDVILRVFEAFPELEFVVFQKDAAPPQSNIRFAAFDPQQFLHSLLHSRGVITTAGHNLLSELMCLGKPVYTLPGDTFDQQFCAYIIDSNALGVSRDTVTTPDLSGFLENLERYRTHILQRRGLIEEFNGLDVLMDRLEARFGL